MAWSYRNDAVFWHKQENNPDEALKHAAEYADKALQLAPDDANAALCPSPHPYRSRRGQAGHCAVRSGDRRASNVLAGSASPLLFVGRIDEAIDRIKQAMGIDPFHPDWYHWDMGWALWEKNDCEAALTAMRKMSRIPSGAHRMLAGDPRLSGKPAGGKGSACGFPQRLARRLHQPTTQAVGEELHRPRSLERWIGHMRFAGLPE
jgi:adenylate cyclase